MKVHRKVRLYEKKLILLIFSLFVLLICSESYFYIMSKKYPEISMFIRNPYAYRSMGA